MKKLSLMLAFMALAGGFAFSQDAPADTTTDTAPADDTTAPADTSSTVAPADTTSSTPASATPSSAAAAQSATPEATAQGGGSPTERLITSRQKNQPQKGFTIEIDDISARFVMGIDLTATNLDQEDSVVAGLINKFYVNFYINFLEKQTDDNKEGDKKVRGFIRLKDFQFSVFNKWEYNGAKSGDFYERDVIDSMQAEIELGPAYINILGRNWADYNMSTPDYLTSVSSDIDSDYMQGYRSVRDFGPGMTDFAMALDKRYYLGNPNSLSPGGNTGEIDKDNKRHRGISVGARFSGDNAIAKDVFEMDFSVDFASRFDWSSGDAGNSRNGGGSWDESPNTLDDWGVGSNGVRFAPNLKDGKGDKNWGHDFLLGFNMQMTIIKSLHIDLWAAFALGNWDNDIGGKYNSKYFNSKDTLDPMEISFALRYDLDIGDKFRITPGVALDAMLGTYYLGRPDSTGIDMTAAVRFQWKKDDKATFGDSIKDNSLFVVDDGNKESEGDGKWDDPGQSTYGDPGEGSDEKHYPGISVGLNFLYATAPEKEYDVDPNQTNTPKKQAAHTDQSMGLKISTYEPALGGIVPGIGWALSFELYNVARKITHDGKDARDDYNVNHKYGASTINSSRKAYPWTSYIGGDAASSNNNDLIDWDAIRYSMGLKLWADLKDFGLPSIQPGFEWTMLENGKAHKFGVQLKLAELIEHTTFTLAWKSDRILFGNNGKEFYQQTRSDFGMFIFETRITW